MPKEAWKKYVKSLPVAKQKKMLLIAIERLMECDEVRFREECIDPNPDFACEPCIYWETTGNDIGE